MKKLMQVTLAVAFLALTSQVVSAAPPAKGKGDMAPSKEHREEMAKAHEKMALCLRSESSVEDCHDELMKSCKEHGENCPMMGKMHHGRKGK